jgi:intracellular multiplication protein IcmE
MVLIGGTQLLQQANTKRIPAAAKLDPMQPIQSVPGGVKKTPSYEYKQLQMQHNKQIAEEAKRTGKSAIATIVDSFELDPANPSSDTQRRTIKQQSQNNFPSLGHAQEVESTIAYHKALMSEQKIELNKQQMQSAMAQQIHQLMTNWAQPSQQESIKGEQASLSPADKLPRTQALSLIKSGTLLQAILLTPINSDTPGPILAKILTGKFKEGRLIGNLIQKGENLLIQFHTLNLPDNAPSLRIQAIAIDPNTSQTTLASKIDRHLIQRCGSLFVASLFQFYGMVSNKLSTQPNRLPDSNMNLSEQLKPNNLLPLLNPTSQVLAATGNVANEFSMALAQNVHRPPTIRVRAGIGIGILFTADLTTSS